MQEIHIASDTSERCTSDTLPLRNQRQVYTSIFIISKKVKEYGLSEEIAHIINKMGDEKWFDETKEKNWRHSNKSCSE